MAERGRSVWMALGLLIAVLGGMLLTGCGRSDGVVIVHVNGLDRTITELYVTMQINGMPGKNPLPQQGETNTSFLVYDDMQRFGIQAPGATTMLDVKIDGHNTGRVVVASGSGSINPMSSSDLDITLTPVPSTM